VRNWPYCADRLRGDHCGSTSPGPAVVAFDGRNGADVDPGRKDRRKKVVQPPETAGQRAVLQGLELRRNGRLFHISLLRCWRRIVPRLACRQGHVVSEKSRWSRGKGNLSRGRERAALHAGPRRDGVERGPEHDTAREEGARRTTGTKLRRDVGGTVLPRPTDGQRPFQLEGRRSPRILP